ncbi:MAG TPA: hypothetical protein VFR90_14855 [Methylibium sp.]|nr:hypothetical protein [Methylibium sp.]HEU4460398.1 hypothetical protein [Methylibium sp.]
MEAQDETPKREPKASKATAGLISVQLPPMSSAFDTGWLVAA